MDMQAQQQSHPLVREASQADLQHWRQHPEEYWTGVAAALLCTHCPTRTGWGPESWSTLQLIAFDAVGLGAVMRRVHDVEQACTELLRVAACASKIAAPGDDVAVAAEALTQQVLTLRSVLFGGADLPFVAHGYVHELNGVSTQHVGDVLRGLHKQAWPFLTAADMVKAHVEAMRANPLFSLKSSSGAWAGNGPSVLQVQVSCFWQCYKLSTPGDLDAGHSLTAADHYFELITQQQTHQQHEYKPRTDMYKITGHK
jgi:hypothetical protein